MAYFVYLLKSLKDGNFYIGQTDDPNLRLRMHNDGLVQSTRSRRPFELVGFEEYKNRNEARWREYELKKSAWKRKKFIETLLASGSTKP